HTRWPRDWSSDVCSSDLIKAVLRRTPGVVIRASRPSAKVRAKLIHPVRSKRVVLAPFVRIREYFVCLIDLFKLLFCLFVTWIHIGVVLTCQLAKRLFNLVTARLTRNSEYFVIVFVLHGSALFCPYPGGRHLLQ